MYYYIVSPDKAGVTSDERYFLLPHRVTPIEATARQHCPAYHEKGTREATIESTRWGSLVAICALRLNVVIRFSRAVAWPSHLCAVRENKKRINTYW